MIFWDLADNNVLDKRYCAADINRALRSPSLRGYDLPTPPRPKPSPKVIPAAATDTRGSLPFSGLDLALFGGVGAPLLLIGASLGRVARVRAQGELRP